MKKMRLFGLLMAMIMGVSFTSCEEDEANIYITIDESTPVPTEDVIVGTNLNFLFTVISDNNIEEILIREGSKVYKTITKDELLAKKSHRGEFSFVADAIKTLYFAIEVEDSKGKIEIKDFQVTVVAAPGDINTYKAVLIGNNKSTTGSFYSTSTNEVFQIGQSAANAAKIDFIYLLDETKHVLAAPSDAFVTTIFSGVADWTPRNATKLKITLLSTTAFDAISNDAEITEQTNVDLTLVSELAVDDVVAFTAQGKKGLFKVESIVDNTMTIEVKVQK